MPLWPEHGMWTLYQDVQTKKFQFSSKLEITDIVIISNVKAQSAYSLVIKGSEKMLHLKYTLSATIY